jgi:hypothetical protein
VGVEQITVQQSGHVRHAMSVGFFQDLFYEAKNSVDTCEKISEVMGLNTRATTGGCRSPGLRTDLKHMMCAVI